MPADYQEDLSRIPDAPLMTIEIEDRDAGLSGFVCIHSMGRNGSGGGMRCVPDITRDEVQLLAKAMTYKYSFWNIELGGAKAGLSIPFTASPDRKRELIQRAATHLKPIVKSYIWSPWTDMHFYSDDLRAFCSSADMPSNFSDTKSAVRTAISAIASVMSAAEYLRKKPDETKIAIEGFGHVAHSLAEFAFQRGMKIVAVSNRLGCIVNDAGLDLKKLLATSQQKEAEWITSPGPWEFMDKQQLFAVPCDILVPGARVHAVDQLVTASINAKAVVPTANVPCTDEALDDLDRRGIVYIPDYVVNGGGVCGHILGGDQSEEQIHMFLEQFISMVVRMLNAAEKMGVPARRLADEVAHKNYGSISRGAYKRDEFSTRLIRKLQNKRLLPGNLEAKSIKRRAQRTYEHMNSAFR